ncbi:hypothetical protein DFJ74DRAFT_28621 [Hyaloraphidium curvatum]|nr:hypothetical protein DFJ74DRAFT_28621 [Hyaloraphidium curvatum]
MASVAQPLPAMANAALSAGPPAAAAGRESAGAKARRDHECSICMDFVLPHMEPVILEACSHFFCRECITGAIRRGGTACPVCRRPCNLQQVLDLATKVLLYRRYMKVPNIPCPLESGRKATVGHFDEHYQTRCTKARCEDCDTVVRPPDNMQHHKADVCPETLLACDIEGCNNFFARQLLAQHRNECPHRIVPCSFPGCSHKCKSRDLQAHMDAAAAEHLAYAISFLSIPKEGERSYLCNTFELELPAVDLPAANRIDLEPKAVFVGGIKFRFQVWLMGQSAMAAVVLDDSRIRSARIKAAVQLQPEFDDDYVDEDPPPSALLLTNAPTSFPFTVSNDYLDVRTVEDGYVLLCQLRIYIHEFELARANDMQVEIEPKRLTIADGLVDGEEWRGCPF